MDDYKFYDFESNKGGRGRSLDENTIRIHNKKGNRSLVVNKYVTELIQKNNLLKLRIREDCITGELCMVFNKDKGRLATAIHGKDSRCITFSSIDLVQLILNKLGVKSNCEGSWDVEIELIHSSEMAALCKLKRVV